MKNLKNLKNWKIWKIDKYLTGEEIFSSNQRQIIEQTKFCTFSFRKGFRKTKRKTDWYFKVARHFQ